MTKGGEVTYGSQEEAHEEGRRKKDIVLKPIQAHRMRELHRKVKGSYLQLTQLMDELDILE